MDPNLFARGLGIGFAIAAVLGPIGLLCIRRTLTSGFLVGFVSGLGAASADGTYAAVAGFGLTAISGVLVEQRLWPRLIGGLFLLYLGVRSVRASAPPLAALDRPRRIDLLAAYSSTLVLTLSNPLTILSFGAVLAGLGLGTVEGGAPGAAASLVLGVFAGSGMWWLVLSTVTARLRTRLTPARLRLVNLGSGLLILAFAGQSLLAVVFGG